jgi:hypothetical protein
MNETKEDQNEDHFFHRRSSNEDKPGSTPMYPF